MSREQRGGAPTRISFGKLRLDTGVPALVLFAIAGAFFWLGMDYTNPIGLAEAGVTQLHQALATAEARAAAAEDHLQAFEFEVSGEIAWQGADQPQFAVNVCVLEPSTLRGRMLGHAPRTFLHLHLCLYAGAAPHGRRAAAGAEASTAGQATMGGEFLPGARRPAPRGFFRLT